MALDKAIESGKEHRKQYRGCQAIDVCCRCHGSCLWCQGNRKHKIEKRKPIDENGKLIDKKPNIFK